MARTKASVGAKVSSGKSSKARCSVAPPPSSSSSAGTAKSSSLGGGGGNPVCPQPTPKWQRPITNFFISKEPRSPPGSASDDDGGSEASTSRPKKRNVIESDDEEVAEQEASPEPAPADAGLRDNIALAPLRGEDSHKIQEYYSKNQEEDQTNGENIDNHPENVETEPKNGETPKNGVKGKGKGKKTKLNKENITTNIEEDKRKSIKRDLEETDQSDHVSKKIKVN